VKTTEIIYSVSNRTLRLCEMKLALKDRNDSNNEMMVLALTPKWK